jgi:ankyrin repeat protein
MSFWKRLFRTEKTLGGEPSDSSPLPEIHRAAGDGRLELVQTLLKDDAGLVFVRDVNGYTPLFSAVVYGRMDVTWFLLSNNAEVNVRDNFGNTPLQLAPSREIAELLATHKADVNSRNAAGYTPFLNAAASGRTAVMELLLAHGAELNTKSVYGWTPLHQAACGHIDTVKFLLSKGVDVNGKDNKGRTALHVAAFCSKKEMVELLLANKAEVQATDTGGFTPLHWAAKSPNKETAKKFLDHKADINARSKPGAMPYFFEEKEDDGWKMRDAAVPGDGLTPLGVATLYGFSGMTELLLQHGACQ